MATPKPKTKVFSKRIPIKVLAGLAMRGIDPGVEIENVLNYLSGVTVCPTCSQSLPPHKHKKVK